MPQTVLDCKGMACPRPVLECRKVVDEQRPQSMRVLVDNPAARENVTRFLASKGYGVDSGQEAEGVYWLSAEMGAAQPAAAAPDDACEVLSPEELARLAGPQKVTVFITAPTIGSGDDTLGGRLMKNFLLTLPELGQELWRVILVNGGVTLATADSPVLAELRKLEAMGATILVCGTCLEFFGVLDQKAVGQTTNMLDVVTSLQAATKVIQV